METKYKGIFVYGLKVKMKTNRLSFLDFTLII